MKSHPKGIKTAENVFAIIEKVEELDQPTCSELANHVDLSTSTVYNYLNTLENEGYMIKTDGRYRLSLKFLQKGRAVRNSYPIMHACVEPIDILAKSIDEYISVFVREGERVVMIHEANSRHAVLVPAPFLGEPFDWVKTPQAKVLLAVMPDSFQQKILSSMDLDEQKLTDVRAELDAIEETEMGFDEGQAHENIWAIAAPVKAGGKVHGSIMISTVRHHITEQRASRELPQLLKHTVKEVEHRLSTYEFTDLYSAW